ncbi:MAG: universal stress protein [Ignavibacteriales bacterium]|nr:universal stress protein [Ignavibacteriales bacterium]
MAKKKKSPERSARGTVRRTSSRIRLRRILVPIDFSEYSKNALKYAIPFAHQFLASIDLLYVVEPAIYPADFSFGQVGFPNVEEELRKRGTEELESLMKKEIGRRLPARFSVRTGKPFYEINQYAREEDVDLIIIATHGHSGMEHILFGSTAEKVVRKAPCPVLVVRSGEKEFV